MTVRPVPAVSVVAGMRIASSVTDTQWVNNVTDTRPHYVFGRLAQTTVSFTGRVSYTMKPTLSLQLYAEPFVSAGDYGAFKELVDGRNPVYTERYSPFAYADNPDFNYRSFRTTNVLRWEYRPGSTLFVVWQQAREGSVDDGSFRFRPRLPRHLQYAGEECVPRQAGLLVELLRRHSDVLHVVSTASASDSYWSA